MKKHEQTLRDHDIKVTEARKSILDVLEKAEGFLSAEDIYLYIKKKLGNLSLSTVYRSLEQMISGGIVQTVSLDHSKEAMYELAHDHHAHHLICLSCNKVIHVHECPVHDYEESVNKTHGFQVSYHKLDLYGYCEDCKS